MNGLFDGIQSSLNPRGAEAAMVTETAWIMFAGGGAILLAVVALALYAIFARRGAARRLPERALIVGGGILLPIATLTALLVYTLLHAAALAPRDEGDALRVEITGEQWWWRVQYLDQKGERDFALANELRIPVGRLVELRLRSNDVIHSFWVPALAGKLDMIPGRTNRLQFKASQTGLMRGQCAEYCGGPHALMAIAVVAQTPEEYARWADNQRQSASPASGDASPVGKRVFEAHCAGCHTVRGTAAGGIAGPDLTHIGSRLRLGAGLLPMNAGTLAGWITSSQHLKPGNLMPEFRHFSGQELAAVATYLKGLD